MTKRTCSYIDCDKVLTSHSARGLCSGHYQQWKRGEDLRALEPRNVHIPWIEAHVEHDGDECLTYPFPLTALGRGQVKYHGKMIGAHRLMCILAHGQPPTPKHEAAHSCGNGHLSCVNPKHLRWATDKENKADMVLHGTRVQGERIPWSILTEGKVRAIRELAHTTSRRAIADLFGIRPGHVEKVVARRIWRHVA